jgi:hypothetical protein
LYAFDGLHPSEAGSYVAALVMFETLYDRSPANVPDRLRLRTGVTIALPASVGAILRAAAADVRATAGI